MHTFSIDENAQIMEKSPDVKIGIQFSTWNARSTSFEIRTLLMVDVFCIKLFNMIHL